MKPVRTMSLAIAMLFGMAGLADAANAGDRSSRRAMRQAKAKRRHGNGGSHYPDQARALAHYTKLAADAKALRLDNFDLWCGTQQTGTYDLTDSLQAQLAWIESKNEDGGVDITVVGVHLNVHWHSTDEVLAPEIVKTLEQLVRDGLAEDAEYARTLDSMRGPL